MPRFQSVQPVPAAEAPGTEPGHPSLDGRRTFTIGEMARDFRVTLRALRFYETKGMLCPRRRNTSRFYTIADRERLATILRGKELGFSLRQIREMIAGSITTTPRAPLPLSADKITDQIAALEAQKAAIERSLAGLRDHAAQIPRGNHVPGTGAARPAQARSA